MKKFHGSICFLNRYQMNMGGGIGRAAKTLAENFNANGLRTIFLSINKRYDDLAYQYYLDKNLSEENAFIKAVKDYNISVVFMLPHECNFAFVAKKIGVKFVTQLHFSPFPYGDDYLSRKVPSIPCRALFQSIAKSYPIKAIFFYFLKKRLEKIYRYAAINSDYFAVLSESVKSELAEFFPGKKCPNNVIAIGNPINVPIAINAHRKKQLLFVGRIDNQSKRVDLLLNIWSKLWAKNPEWELIIVGDGQDLAEMKELAEALKLQQIRFEGFQKPEKYYEQASIFCMTSQREGFPMVLLEACAGGCVPVAFDAFATAKDIIEDGENGFLVPAFDISYYTEKLQQLINSPTLLQTCAVNSRKKAEKYEVERIAKEWGTHLFCTN